MGGRGMCHTEGGAGGKALSRPDSIRQNCVSRRFCSMESKCIHSLGRKQPTFLL